MFVGDSFSVRFDKLASKRETFPLNCRRKTQKLEFYFSPSFNFGNFSVSIISRVD